jgi:two-component system nitrogen regulation sensor histidine kinase NtrY
VLLVRVVAERADQLVTGYVVTLDDITDLLAAQRQAAWADVARRIAHEIKNPLTPIQLSAERLKRKYLKRIEDDKETFIACTDTIVRQVGDIGRMVDEFSAFARMPTPVMKPEDLNEVVTQSVFLARTGYPGVEFGCQLPPVPSLVRCDLRQIGQAITNLLKNAVEATQPSEEEGKASKRKRQVAVTLAEQNGHWRVIVEDNGRGLPASLRDRLTEPYVTTRAKGTGLGLAIVKKIMEDHGGELTLEDREGGGARVSLVFPAQEFDLNTGVAVS